LWFGCEGPLLQILPHGRRTAHAGITLAEAAYQRNWGGEGRGEGLCYSPE
jgi:hypothetical protein